MKRFYTITGIMIHSHTILKRKKNKQKLRVISNSPSQIIFDSLKTNEAPILWKCILSQFSVNTQTKQSPDISLMVRFLLEQPDHNI